MYTLRSIFEANVVRLFLNKSINHHREEWNDVAISAMQQVTESLIRARMTVWWLVLSPLVGESQIEGEVAGSRFSSGWG
jgi:hypothetical protein